ncbi:MAG: hypothetical protein H8E87_07635 [FCB group bacterium]|nr:hypothetical protein [FCB group bacterium]
MLAINTLRTESEQSEYKGFAFFLKGIFGMFRNVTARAPKIKWAKNEALWRRSEKPTQKVFAVDKRNPNLSQLTTLD